MLESILSLFTVMAPTEHPSDNISPRLRSKTVAEDEWTMEVVEDGDDGCGCCELVKGGRFVRSVVNASGGELCSWWGSWS